MIRNGTRWRGVLETAVAWGALVLLVVAIVKISPRIVRSVSALRVRFAETRIVLAVTNVFEARQDLDYQHHLLIKDMGSDELQRIYAAKDDGCKALYSEERTQCLTLAQFEQERQALDVLSKRLVLTLLSEHPEDVALPSGAKRYAPRIWHLVKSVIFPESDQTEALAMWHTLRAFQSPPGATVRRSVIIGGCVSGSAPDCARGLEAEALKKGLKIVADVPMPAPPLEEVLLGPPK
jgi:hypothetical protein